MGLILWDRQTQRRTLSKKEGTVQKDRKEKHTHSHIYLSIYLSFYIYISIYIYIELSMSMSMYLYLCVYVYICLSIYIFFFWYIESKRIANPLPKISRIQPQCFPPVAQDLSLSGSSKRFRSRQRRTVHESVVSHGYVIQCGAPFYVMFVGLQPHLTSSL
jgi:hypothetical protein